MEIKKRLDKRIQINEIAELSSLATEDSAVLQELYLCLFDENERCSSNAAWILSHVNQEKNKWLKQHLKIKKFWGTTENAVRIQIYTAICTYCLVAIVQHDNCIEVHMRFFKY